MLIGEPRVRVVFVSESLVVLCCRTKKVSTLAQAVLSNQKPSTTAAQLIQRPLTVSRERSAAARKYCVWWWPVRTAKISSSAQAKAEPFHVLALNYHGPQTHYQHSKQPIQSSMSISTFILLQPAPATRPTPTAATVTVTVQGGRAFQLVDVCKMRSTPHHHTTGHHCSLANYFAAAHQRS